MDQNDAVDVVDAVIVSERVADESRQYFLPWHLGRRFIQGEGFVFDWARRLSTEYSGGMWVFYSLSNGSFFVAPEITGPVAVSWHLNGYEGQMSAEAFGIVVTLFTLCYMAEVFADDLYVEKYHALRDYALQHAEQREIFKAID